MGMRQEREHAAMIRKFTRFVLLLAAPAALLAAPAAAQTAAPVAETGASALDLVWSVRSGLNVAALQCRNADLTSNYNVFLKRHANLLAAAYAAQEQRFRRQFAAGWQTQLDAALTRQFNMYVLLPDTQAFCRWATALAADLAGRAPDELAGLAAAATAAITPAAPILLVAR